MRGRVEDLYLILIGMYSIIPHLDDGAVVRGSAMDQKDASKQPGEAGIIFTFLLDPASIVFLAIGTQIAIR